MESYLQMLPINVIDYICSFIKNEEIKYEVKVISLVDRNIELNENNIHDHHPILMISFPTGNLFVIDRYQKRQKNLNIKQRDWKISIYNGTTVCCIYYKIEQDVYLFQWTEIDLMSMLISEVTIPAKDCARQLLLFLSSRNNKL